MVNLGVCCADLEEDKSLMKMGLGMVLIGHINFLLGALVHGAVLRHIMVHKQARSMEYAVSNVIALVCGLAGVVTGILAIILSRKKKKKNLAWALLALSAINTLLAFASVVGLTLSVVTAVANDGYGLLTHCNITSPLSYYTITDECPFDPTRIYSTTITLWVLLIFMCAVASVFSGRSFHACLRILGACCRPRKRKRVRIRQERVLRVDSPTAEQPGEPSEPPEESGLLSQDPTRNTWL
ncbi:keratinocyte-associated protein 3-like isoform X2 [Lepisosteus oculatus]|uniref:Transmembrane protein 54b n=1 Tax=Lepisosteus oculatus TaxID=7918 RepID=W5M1N3_LEPOC|nr:PREDICTED: keratinocyte-associated protein 3-like [Lepisosteus oculatus]